MTPSPLLRSPWGTLALCALWSLPFGCPASYPSRQPDASPVPLSAPGDATDPPWHPCLKGTPCPDTGPTEEDDG